MELRPHHGLCIAHFRGLGYNEEFVVNMKMVIAKLKSSEEPVTLVCHTDVICSSCPHNQNGECNSGQKVLSYDQACLELCGFQENQKVTWGEYAEQVKNYILLTDKLTEVCKECEWLDICTNNT
jgi:Uncharacterized conserved protein